MLRTERTILGMRESLEMLRKSFARSLRSAGKTGRTVETYTEAVEMFIRFLEDPPASRAREDEESAAELLARVPVRDETDLRRAHFEAFIAHQMTINSPGTALNRFGGLRQWCKWMAGEADIDVDVSPMAGMDQPAVPEKDVEIIPVQHLAALLKTCDRKTFAGLRDEGIMHLFGDCGLRLAELTGLMAVEIIDGERVPFVDLDTQTVYVLGKGRRPRTVSFGDSTAVALDRYMRKRSRQPLANRPEMWLSAQARYRGPLSANGIRQMIDRRCDEAEIPHYHPHQFRHTWADAAKRAGLDRGDLKRQGGWKSDAMVDRYGAAAADDRAQTAHRAKSFMDRI